MLALKDPLLNEFGMIIVENLHKRTVGIDILLGITKKLRKMRPQLKLVCEMAIDDGSLTEQIKSFYGSEHVTALSIDTSMTASHVDIMYLSKPAADYLQASVDSVLRLVKNKKYPDDDIIVILANHDEIRLVKSMLQNPDYREIMRNASIIPVLDSSILSDNQTSIITEDIDSCRIILATGEDSENNYLLMTQSKINYVVDCGFSGPRRQTRPITKLDAELRKSLACYSKIGHAGQVFRLYTQTAAVSLLGTKDIPTANGAIEMALLRLKVLGVGNLVRAFPFFTPPQPEVMARALNVLKWIEALDNSGNVTELGNRMARVPIDSLELAHSIIKGASYRCQNEMIKISAMISAGGMAVYVDPGTSVKQERAAECHDKFKAAEGDLITLLNVFNAYKSSMGFQWCKDNFLSARILNKARDIYNKLRIIATTNQAVDIQATNIDQMIKCLEESFYLNLGKIRTDGSLALVDRSTGDLISCSTNRHSVYYKLDRRTTEKMESPWFVFQSQKNVVSANGDDEILIEGLSMAYRSGITKDTSYWKSL